ncbi:MAG: PHB depolymerase family esterase [Armatimonadota bacterium]|nr:PHB depolymerase family esterase [Armatimonadota bacterium]MDR7518621.1 PHB depolymerase family esterase [Armatimonadota bacterium]MDR7548488.1 PHB depolymerase family esterase [Armatimonadota bacterium]
MRGLRVNAAALILVVATAMLWTGRNAAAWRGPGGSQPHTIIFGGLTRTYRTYVPSGGAGPMPLLLALHGGGGSGAAMERLTQGGLNRLADRERFVVVYPDGVDRHWNDGRGIQAYRAHREDLDDVGFIAALIGRVAQSVPIDERRVYATGISNGGLMAFRLARELADRVAAIALVATSMSEPLAQMPGPARAISVLLMPGTQDPLVPWSGGEIGFPGRLKVGRVISVPETIRLWAAHNDCPPTATVTWEPDRDPQDGTRVRREAYRPCRDGTEVVLYAIEGGGHTWPGGWQYLPQRIVGRTSRDIDANEVIWTFLRRHRVR